MAEKPKGDRLHLVIPYQFTTGLYLDRCGRAGKLAALRNYFLDLERSPGTASAQFALLVRLRACLRGGVEVGGLHFGDQRRGIKD